MVCASLVLLAEGTRRADARGPAGSRGAEGGCAGVVVPQVDDMMCMRVGGKLFCRSRRPK